jgi:5-methylthioadenosine/S-adenosylhomocysteine deaminase
VACESLELGQAALLPGLVNTHTHLELTALRGLVTERPFPRWVSRIKRIKNLLGPDEFRAAARWGVLESFAAGITTLGDTGSSGEPARAMAALGARGIAYHEVFGPDPARCAESLRGLELELEVLAGCASERVTIGVSPHAPYTVSAPLLAAVAELAGQRRWPVAMHLAESPEESQFVERGKGPFADALRSRGVLVHAHGRSPVVWALGAGLERVRPLLIHCVSAGERDLAAVAGCGASVAHCPWSNVALGNGRADLAAMRRLRIKVGVGTDSVAAGGSYDLFAEARLAAAGLALSGREVLALVTAGAADALGVADVGRIAAGAWGDLVAISLTRAPFVALADPEAAIAWSATAGDVCAAWVAGRAVYRAGDWPGVDAVAERAAFERSVESAAAARAA